MNKRLLFGLGYYPVWVKQLAQPLGQNNPVAGFVHISPLYLTQLLG